MQRGLRIVAIYSTIAVLFVVSKSFYPWNVFLFLTGGLWWFSIIINLMMAHITLSAVLRTIDRRWILLPICAYGIWFSAIGIYDFHERQRQKDLSVVSFEPNLASADRILIVRGKPSQFIAFWAFHNWVWASPSTSVYGGGLHLYAGSPAECAIAQAEPGRTRLGGFFRGPANQTSRPGPCVLSEPALEPANGLLVSRLHPSLDESLRSYEISRLSSNNKPTRLGVVNIGHIPFAEPLPIFEGLAPKFTMLHVNEPESTKGEAEGLGQDEAKIVSLIGLPKN